MAGPSLIPTDRMAKVANSTAPVVLQGSTVRMTVDNTRIITVMAVVFGIGGGLCITIIVGIMIRRGKCQISRNVSNSVVNRNHVDSELLIDSFYHRSVKVTQIYLI